MQKLTTYAISLAPLNNYAPREYRGTPLVWCLCAYSYVHYRRFTKSKRCIPCIEHRHSSAYKLDKGKQL